MHIKWTVTYDGHFKRTIRPIGLYLSCFITKIIIGLIVSEFMYSLGYRLIVCPYTLDSTQRAYDVGTTSKFS